MKLRVSEVRIIDAAAWSSLRNGDDHLFVRVEAGSYHGLYGPLSGVVSDTIARRFAHELRGVDPFDHETFQEFREQSVGPEPTMSSAIGSLDCALWDLHGRFESVPVAHLLRRESAPCIRTYLSWLGLDLRLPTAIHQIERIVDEGWTITKWALPKATNRPATEHEAATLAQLVLRAADAAGGPVAIDALATWDATTTRRFACHIDRSAIRWLEDPLPTHSSAEDYVDLSAERLPIGIGEHLYGTRQAASMLGLVHPAALTFDVVGLGGITAATKVLQLVKEVKIPVYLHGRAFAPAIHLAAAFPDQVAAVEYQYYWEPRRQQFLDTQLLPQHGSLPIPSGPGLGLRLRN